MVKAVNYMFGTLFMAFPWVGFSLLFAQLSTNPINAHYPFPSRFFFGLFLGAPYTLALASYFTFRKRTYDPSKTFFENNLPSMVAFLGMLALFVLVQFFFGRTMVPSSVQLKMLETQKALNGLVSKERSEAKQLQKAFQLAPSEAPMDELLKRARTLHERFPRNLIVERLLLRAEASVGLGAPEDKGNTTLLRRKSGLEKRAIEAQNNQDYMGAALLYKTLISILPGRQYVRHRQTYADRMRLCLELAQNPNSHLTEEDMHKQSFNRRLNSVRNTLKKEPLRNAFFEARSLYLHEPSETRAKELYESLHKQMSQEDFFAWEVQRLRENNLPFEALGPINLDQDGTNLQATSSIPTPNALFLEGVVLRGPTETISAKHAKWFSNTLLLLTNPSSPAQVVPTQTPAKTLLQLVELQQANPPLLVAHLNPYALHQLQKTATNLFDHHPYYWGVAFLYQVGLVPFAVLLFLLNTWYSLREQPRPHHPINLLATTLRNIGWVFAYLILVLGAGLWANLTNHFLLPATTLLLFVLSSMLLTFTRIAKTTLTQTNPSR